MSDDAPNALGLEFSQSAPEVDEPAVFTPASPGSATAETSVRKEKTPYVNPDRFRTGGAQREKLTEEALAEKMARIREQNAKIKERRMHVQQDEDAFRKYQEEDRQRQEELKKFQDEMNSARASYAKLKMDQVGNREWDSLKQSEGDSWDGGGRRGGRDRRFRQDRGGTGDDIGPDWANEPTEAVNNWGDAPIGGDIAQWLPKDSSTMEKAGDEDTAEPSLNWAGDPVPSIADWAVPSGASNEPERDWAGNIIGTNQDWTVTPSEPQEYNSGGGSGRGRGRGRGDGERRGRGRGEGKGRGGRGGGRGRGRTESGGVESKQYDVANSIDDPVSTIGDWNVPTADEIKAEDVSKVDIEGPQLDWAGNPVPSIADWSTPSNNASEGRKTADDQTYTAGNSWKNDRGRGRGRGGGDGGRGRGEGRGRGGGKARGRSESGWDRVEDNEEKQTTWAADPVPTIGDWSVPTTEEPKAEDTKGVAEGLNWAGDPVPSIADWSVPSGDSNEPERNWAGDIINTNNSDWGAWQVSEDPSEPAVNNWKGDRGRGRGRGRGEGGRGRGEGRGRGWGDSDRGRGRGDGGRGRGRGEGRGRGRGDGNRGRGGGGGGGGRGRGEGSS